MSGAALRKDLQLRILHIWLRQCPFGHRAIQSLEAMTVQMADQVGRGEFEESPDLFHHRLAAPDKWRKTNGP